MQRLAFDLHLSLCIQNKLVIMKPLILSFFAVIFTYSLFFDKKEEPKPAPETINNRSIYINSADSLQNINSVIFYADKYTKELIQKSKTF